MAPQGAELLGAGGAKAGEHGANVEVVLLPRQLDQGSEGPRPTDLLLGGSGS